MSQRCGQIPEVHSALGQQRLAELDGPLQTETEHQVQVVPESQRRGLAQGLAGRTDVPGGAVGGGDRASGDLRVATPNSSSSTRSRMLLGASGTIAGGTHVG